MKTYIVFNQPEDDEVLKIHQQAHVMYCALNEIKDYIRSTIKYGEPSEDVERHLEMILEIIPELE